MGMWLLQECRRCWTREGKETSYPYLDAEVQRAEPFRSLVDCDDALFTAPVHMPSAIAQFCMRTGQPVPRSQGETVRCIFESLAFLYKQAIDAIETATKKTFPAVHLLGGASQNQTLCQYVADATEKSVISGPVEATALGNALVQMSALGFVPGDAAHGELVRGSFPVKTYQPVQPQKWREKYAYFRRSIAG